MRRKHNPSETRLLTGVGETRLLTGVGENMLKLLFNNKTCPSIFVINIGCFILYTDMWNIFFVWKQQHSNNIFQSCNDYLKKIRTLPVFRNEVTF
jgi:hypothetical protein